VVRNNSIVTYLIVFFVLSLILKLFGVIEISYSELAGYLLIFYGIGAVYTSMGRNKKGILFIGSVAFLIGVMLFITSNYDITRFSNVVLPSIFFILGTAFLVLFIDDLSNKMLIIVSIIFFLSGFFFFAKLGTFSISDFIKATLSIIIKYWLVVIILTAIILLLKKNQRS
jgi:hypothetical protein